MLVRSGVAVIAVLGHAAVARAQVEYVDLDAGRPLRVQDAYAIARYAFELQLGPAVEAPPASGTHWLFAPTLAWGALPRTQIEIAAPIASVPVSADRTTALSGLEVGALYDFNVETLALPALAIDARATLPVGPLAPPNALLSVEGIATRSWPGLRLHVNAAATIGPAGVPAGGLERDRWFAGAAIDHSWPRRSVLAAAELVVEQPLAPSSASAWSAGAGGRWQWTPQLVLDAGVSRRFTGDDIAWNATLGITWAFAVRAFMPVPR